MLPSPKKKQVPQACIRIGVYAYCGREPYSDEFTFNDAEHAVKFYAESSVIKACPWCVKKAKQTIVAGEQGPIATRNIDH